MVAVSTARVLVIEDDSELNRLFTKYLAAAGFETAGVASILEAHDWLHTDPPPDVVVLDLALTDGRGTAVLDMLQSPRFAATHVIIVSGRVFTHDCHLGEYANIDAVLMKPVTPRGLTAMVRNLI